MSDLFEASGVVIEGDRWWWHLHGRYLVREVEGWPKEREISRRRVYRYDDCVVAATEAEARDKLEKANGKPSKYHQWLRFGRGGRVRS